MKKNLRRRIEVWADWTGMSEPLMMGILYASPGRGEEVFSFEYNDNWIKSPHAQIIDPSLLLFRGEQYAPDGHNNFGLFLDSAPDRWGRVLMLRREAQKAREEKRPQIPLYESDYLLGVFDQHRMGALRFKIDPKGPFENADQKLSAPPWTSLRELEYASLQLEKDGAEKEKDYRTWLDLLIAPGGSLGGARPKASVIDHNKILWIAKFPSRADTYNVGAWEMLVHTLASKVGIHVPPAKVIKFGGKYHTFLTQRFDRSKNQERIHFASAMTLLQRVDGDDGSKGANYLEIAELIIQSGAKVQKDLQQLWTRIVFSVCVSNIDDHLRNHGFLLEKSGWALSPAYDINPNPLGNGLLLNISETDNSQDLELVRSVAEFFRVKSSDANSIIKQVIRAVSQWRVNAKILEIPISEQERMAQAFRIVDKI